ncbi:adhesin-like protein [Sesbania bispinosa]|nr:adhesin-like protein [Sesbania bispinosa]
MVVVDGDFDLCDKVWGKGEGRCSEAMRTTMVVQKQRKGKVRHKEAVSGNGEAVAVKHNNNDGCSAAMPLRR